MTEKLQLTKSDRKKVWWRSTFLQGSWNYERMQNLGWAYSLIPALKKLYTIIICSKIIFFIWY